MRIVLMGGVDDADGYYQDLLTKGVKINSPCSFGEPARQRWQIAQVIIADDFAVGLKLPETSLHMNRVANHYCRQQQIQRGLGQDLICR